MTNLFISYRRDDSGGHAGRLSDRLIARFGADRIFMDVQDIQPGQNFQQAIQKTLARCDHLLAVIGPRWIQIMQARNAQGEDFVRHEVSVALALGTTVIPVLVGGATMPARSLLPNGMAALSLCQAVEIRDNYFDDDAARLVEFLARGSGAETSAAAIDGDWVAELQRPGQTPFKIRLTLARMGDRIMGSVHYPTGDGSILDGRYENGQMTFHTSHIPQFETEPAVTNVQARMEGDVIRLTVAYAAGVATGVAHRAGRQAR